MDYFFLNLDINREKKDEIRLRDLYFRKYETHIQNDELIIYKQLNELFE